MEERGIANVSLPKRTMRDLTIASVIGRVRVKTVPFPGSVETSTNPPREASINLTTSSPTPRPEVSDTVSLVLKPASNMNSRISFSSRSSLVVIIPRATALFLTFPTSMPRPSSDISMTTLLPLWRARSSRDPASGLPLFFLSAGFSSPWSMAFRTICISGSTTSSARNLSISVSSPKKVRFISFPEIFAYRLTTWPSLLNICPMGTIRISRTFS